MSRGIGCWPPVETEMTETEKMRGALLQALSVTTDVGNSINLTDIADELLAHLERSGWKVVKVDPFTSTNRPDLMNALRDRVARIESFLDAQDVYRESSWREI